MIWLNGAVSDANNMGLAVSDRGFLLGDGVFETLLAVGGRIQHFERHWQRLLAGLGLLEIPVTYKAEEISRAAAALLEGAKTAGGPQRYVLRLSVSRGTGGRGLDIPAAEDKIPPSWLLTLAKAAIPPADISLVTSDIFRHSGNVTSRIKALSYLDNVLARRQARQAGAEEALMLNEHGRVSCAAAGNLFIYDGMHWLTPPVSEGALPGITRQLLLENDSNGMFREAPVTAEVCAQAEAMFVCNSLIGVVPVRELDGGRKEKSPAMQAISNLLTP